MRETIAFIFLFLVFLAGGYGLTFTTVNSPRIYDQISASSNPTLRAIHILENTYLFLYGSAVVEIVFVIFGGFGLINAWSKIVDRGWIVMMIYGLVFLVCAAWMVGATASAYNGAVSPIEGYDPDAVQLRNIMDKLFSTTQMGLGLWILAATLFICLPPIKRALR